MKAALRRIENKLWHFGDGDRIDGPNPDMSGNCSGLRGDCTGLQGDLDDCELTDDDRAAKVNIQSLILSEPTSDSAAEAH